MCPDISSYTCGHPWLKICGVTGRSQVISPRRSYKLLNSRTSKDKISGKTVLLNFSIEPLTYASYEGTLVYSWLGSV